MRSQSAVLPEASLYAPLGEFLRACLGMFGRDTATVAAQARTTFGVPDFVVAEHNMPIGFVEAKRPGVDLARLRGHDKQQLEQFRNLENVLYTDYSAFRLYEHGELVASADLGGTEVLDTAGPSPTAARETELRDLLERFLSHSPTVPANASDLARLLARATRVLRDATAQLMSSDTKGQLSRERDRWRDLLFEDVNDHEFADAYAQTVVYGLLTTRLDQPEGVLTLDGAGEALREHHAFLSAAFRTLTMAEIRQPLDWAVRVVLTVLQPVGLETFRRTRYADDPLLYFYEEFLGAYDKDLQQSRGVYYTPPSVVDFRSVRWQVKTREPVMIVVGNPPYERARGRPASDWLQQLMPTFTDPVRPEARVNLKNLADPYVHFFRWSLWKLFEAAPADGTRVLSFISNRSYLLDYAFEGVRKVLRERFDELWIVDLEGESRGAVATENVFDIRVGVCIIVAVRNDAAPKSGDATVRYTCFRGTRDDKERQLKQDLLGLTWTTLTRGAGEPFLPEPTGAWRRWTPLDVLMPVRQSGVQTKRDKLVVAPTTEVLERQLRAFSDPSVSHEERVKRFHETRDRSTPMAPAFRPDRVRRYGYRPFSRTWLYDERALVDFPRPRLHALWFAGQRGLMTLPKGHGPGPAAVLHTDLPDLHGFRGSYGGHVFPFWLDPDRTAPNLAPGALAALGELYGAYVSADDVFGHVVSVLNAPSYTLLFRDGLAQGFPRLPFPVSAESFAASSGLGRRLLPVLAMETGSGAPVRLHGRPSPIRPGRFTGDRLYVSEAAWVAPVTESAWAYQVSGYRVLPRWLEYRKDLDLSRDLELVDELLATVGAIQRVVEMAPDLESNLEHLLAGDTVGRASVVPFDLATAARQLAAQANDEVAAEARLWDELSDEALRRSEGGS